MKKPSETLLKLYKLGKIKSIEVEYLMTGCDTSTTYWKLVGVNGEKCRFEEIHYTDFLKFEIDWCSIACLHSEYSKEVDDWLKFEKNHKKELSELKRLKAKYE